MPWSQGFTFRFAVIQYPPQLQIEAIKRKFSQSEKQQFCSFQILIKKFLQVFTSSERCFDNQLITHKLVQSKDE